MVSKGVDYFVYLCTPPFGVVVSCRGNDDKNFTEVEHKLVGSIQKDHCEIELNHIGFLEHTGKFQIKASKSGKELATKYVEIAPSSGNLGNTDMGEMLNTHSIVDEANNYAISYGFYDAVLTQSHQSYMYVTGCYSNWMKELLEKVPVLGEKPFGTFVLPGSHDAGMFTGLPDSESAIRILKGIVKSQVKKEWDEATLTEKCQAILAVAIGPSAFTKNPIATALAIPLLAALVAVVTSKALFNFSQNSEYVRNILINLSYTQKDDIKTQLCLGIRHFDFRPGYNVSSYRNQNDTVLRHQHAFIPGYEFERFLSDVVGFLTQHPKEFVVVNIKYAGFMEPDMKPAEREVNELINKSLIGKQLNKAERSDMTQTIDQLIGSNKRLVVLYENDGVLDSYNDNDYATNDPSHVKQAISQVKIPSPPNSNPSKWISLQLQGTATLTKEGIAAAVETSSKCGSPLLGTKARFDHETYQWLASLSSADIKSRYGDSNLVVLLNDFADNALVSQAIAMTKKRVGYSS